MQYNFSGYLLLVKKKDEICHLTLHMKTWCTCFFSLQSLGPFAVLGAVLHGTIKSLDLIVSIYANDLLWCHKPAFYAILGPARLHVTTYTSSPSLPHFCLQTGMSVCLCPLLHTPWPWRVSLSTSSIPARMPAVALRLDRAVFSHSFQRRRRGGLL